MGVRYFYLTPFLLILKLIFMSDKEKTTPKTFKFGDNQYTVTDYNTAYDQNVQDFIEFARQRGQFDDTSIKLLQESLQNRRADINNNIELNHLGGTNADTPNNISIPTYERKGLRKKEKYVDQDITEWVNYFNRSIIDKMNKYTSEPDKPKITWDQSKYGFGAYLDSKNFHSNYYNLDKLQDGQTERGYDQRITDLHNNLNNYLKAIQSYNFDYSKNDNPFDDNTKEQLEYLLTLTAPRTSGESFDINAIKRSLNEVGVTGGDYYNALFDQSPVAGKTVAQVSAEKKAKQEADEKARREQQVAQQNKATQQRIKNIQNIISAKFRQDAQEHGWDTDHEIMHTMNVNAAVNVGKPVDWKKWYTDNETNFKIPYNDISTKFVESDYLSDWFYYWLWQHEEMNNPVPYVNIEGTTYYLNPYDNSDEFTFGYDPKNGNVIKYNFYRSDDNQIQTNLRKKYIKNLSSNPNILKELGLTIDDLKLAYPDFFLKPVQFDSGGILKFQNGGLTSEQQLEQWEKKVKSEHEYQLKQEANEAGISLEELKAKKRRIFGDETFYDDNAGWEGEDIARLVAAGANLVSIFLDPVSGFFTGLGSSVTDFVADLSSDHVSFGQSLKGLVGNVGMDLLGIIPGWGDSVGTMGKIKKTLVHYAPRIIGYLSTASSLQNTPQIIESFKKLIDDPNNVNRDDLKNIVEGINLLATTSQTGRHHVASSRAKQAATTGSDKIQLQVKNTSTGKNETIIVKGNTAKEISKNVSNPDKINAILKNHEGFSNYEVRTDLGRPGLRWVKSKKTDNSDSEWQWPTYWKQNAQVEHFDADKFKKKYKEYYFGSDNAKLLIEPGSTLFSQAPKPRVINDKTNTKSKAETKAIKKYKENLNKQLQELDKLHNDVKDYNNKHTTLENQLNNNRSNIQTTQQSIDNLSKEIVNLEYLTRGKSKMSDVDYDNVKKTLEDLRLNQKEWSELENITLDYRDQKSIKTELDKIENKIQENIQKLTDTDNFNKLSQKRQQLDELNQQKENLNQESKDLENARESLENAKKAFEDLLLQTRKNSNRNSRTYKFDGKTYNFAQPFSIDFDKYKFQQGGKIDMEKINKFLKYAKG